MKTQDNANSQAAVVWGLPSRLIGRIGPVPPNVQLDVMSTAWTLLRRLRGQPCHLLLVHWELPDATGPALAARVRILHSELPIVLTTDREDLPEAGMNLVSLRVVGPMVMPVSWPLLLERVPGPITHRDAVGELGAAVPTRGSQPQAL